MSLRNSDMSLASVNFMPTIFFFKSVFLFSEHFILRFTRLVKYLQISLSFKSLALILMSKLKTQGLITFKIYIKSLLSFYEYWFNDSISFYKYFSIYATFQLSPWSSSLTGKYLFFYFQHLAFQYFSCSIFGAVMITLFA